MPKYDFTTLRQIPNEFVWYNDPENFTISHKGLSIDSKPRTDYWQRTSYYGREDNGHSLLSIVSGNFKITTAVTIPDYTRFGHCGLFVRLDKDNWLSSCTEHAESDTNNISSIVTNRGFSDMSSYQHPLEPKLLYHRISRVGQTFKIEYSKDGTDWFELRITRLCYAELELAIGIYICSPFYDSDRDERGFNATFSYIDIETEGEESFVVSKPMKPFPSRFIESLRSMTSRPSMYFLYTFPELLNFFYGWSYGADNENFDEALARFEAWLNRRFGHVNFNGPWTYYIEDMMRNPDKPFLEFMKLVDEYQTEAIEYEKANIQGIDPE